MVNLNKIFLVGNLTQDPQLRYTPQGAAVATLRIAVNTMFKDRAGEAKKETCFINVIAWGQMAEVCNQYLQKGRAILVEGRLQSRTWQNSEGKNRSTIEVRAGRVQFLPQGGARAQATSDIDLGNEPEEAVPLENYSPEE
ncbi:MAG: single-stranded DNA-binding protein [Candidatus Omnitrophica bacterium]|nr:single-stranded DNA-binding protein [Candidatus Omnitrophota bacterium]